MRKLILSLIAAAGLFAAAPSFAQSATPSTTTYGVGGAVTKGGYGLDMTIDQHKGAVIHGQIGTDDNDHQIYQDQGSHQAFANLDYDLIAPISRNVAFYAGAGIGEKATRGLALRVPFGVQATFDAMPVQVALEVAPTVAFYNNQDPNTHMYTDNMIAVRYLIK